MQGTAKNQYNKPLQGYIKRFHSAQKVFLKPSYVRTNGAFIAKSIFSQKFEGFSSSIIFYGLLFGKLYPM